HAGGQPRTSATAEKHCPGGHFTHTRGTNRQEWYRRGHIAASRTVKSIRSEGFSRPHRTRRAEGGDLDAEGGDLDAEGGDLDAEGGDLDAEGGERVVIVDGGGDPAQQR